MKKDYNLEKRKYVIAGLLIVIVLIYLFRLLELQVFEDKYKANADSNAFLRKTIYPSRGLIYDRNGELIVYNQPAYDVMVIPREVKDFDSIDFCHTLQLSMEELRGYFADMRNPRKNPGYSSYTQQTLITHISAQDYGRLQEKLYRFPGLLPGIGIAFDNPRIFQFPDKTFHCGKRFDKTLRSHNQFPGNVMFAGRVRIAAPVQKHIIQFHTDHAVRQTDGFHSVHKNTFSFHFTSDP